MCISIPARVVSIDGQQAELDVMGTRRKASTLMLPEIQVGDYVLTSAGMIVDILNPDEAQISIALFKDLMGLEPGTDGSP